uniref:ER-bound oxygenase mpaB n=1 Tax=Penicillium brevicompactum TaxID=5074 RepID=MPAB_PENBR|nr:RecName: Full=ER-bound oxygenase mpaB; AltName: Full=Mycophenolic acid biosynthesis cluster protein B [Penicillium brevicompactum]ADY00129.1 MpaB [Penicillium brevicompactum]
MSLPLPPALSELARALPYSRTQWLPIFVGFLIGYPILIRALRYKRHGEMKKKFYFPTRESMAEMTDEEAFLIQKEMAQLEFPFMFLTSGQFALFRTYGIPTISHLLTKTGQFSKPETSFKRYTDTAALIGEMVENSPTSQRAFISVARTRFLHSGYQASGKILDADLLYTLALFAVQPVRFIENFEWRTLSDLELCAIGTFWKSLGDALGISSEILPSGKTGFKDGIQWLEEVDVWSQDYEAKYMVPDPKNRESADQATAMLISNRYEAPTPGWSMVFSTLLAIRKLILRYLSPPRPAALAVSNIAQKPDKDDRYHRMSWDALPFYIRPTFWNRWGPMAWISWLMGHPVPGDLGQKKGPQGDPGNDEGIKDLKDGEMSLPLVWSKYHATTND